MTKTLKTTFLAHAIAALVLGAILLLMPGRFLQAIRWAPIDPIISRILGAALLALAWSSYRGWRARERARVALLVELEAVFTVLSCIGLLRHLTIGHWPATAWGTFAVFALFALAWIVSLLHK